MNIDNYTADKGRGMTGKKHSEESKLKISLKKKGRPSNRKGAILSFETRMKISSNKKGKKVHSEIQKNKWKEMRRGKGNPAWVNGLSYNKGHYSKIRMTLEKKASGFHSEKEWDNLKLQYNFTCPCCKKNETEIKLTKDHIIPLVKGGSHNIENIQPLCQSCNSRKNTKIIHY